MTTTVRGHWPFVVVLAGGLILRVLTEVAYRPALLYIDSGKYLVSSGGTAPEGYQVMLRLLDPVGGLALVAAVQHAFGLAMAIAVYALLIRHRVPRWAATLAAAPVLLDAYQLQLEQTVMPDVLFETMIAAALVLLLWPRPPERKRLWPIAAGALVLGATATVREIGVVLIVPIVVFAVATAPGWRRKSQAAALAAACFVLPAVGYMAAAFFVTGHFGLASNGPAPEYGRAAAAADCATLRIPADERALCPSGARTLALGGIDGLLHNPQSPGHTVPVPPGTTRAQLLEDFSLATFRQQPLRVAASVARDSVRLFALTRDGDPEITSIARWQFQTFYPTYPHRYTMAVFSRLARDHGSGGDLVAVKPAATVLRDYQLGGGYTPGPLYAACPGRRAARIALRPGPGQAAHRRRPRTGRPRTSQPRTEDRLPAGDAVRRGAPAQLRRLRVLLALPAARRGHAARRRRARAHRPGRPGRAPARKDPRSKPHCCSDRHRRYRSTNSSRICGVRSRAVGQRGRTRAADLTAVQTAARRYSSTNSSRICGVRSSDASRPVRLMVSALHRRKDQEQTIPLRGTDRPIR